MAGYAPTPLAKKLSLTPGMQVIFEGMPPAVEAQILSDVGPLSQLARASQPVDPIHLFTTEAAHLRRQLPRARTQIVADGLIWVSSPNAPRNSQWTSPRILCARWLGFGEAVRQADVPPDLGPVLDGTRPAPDARPDAGTR